MAESEETKKFRQQMLAGMEEMRKILTESREILEVLRQAKAATEADDDDD